MDLMLTATMKLIRLLLLSVVLFTTAANAQLSNFNLQVSKTDETCLGNGSLTFSVTNLTPQATLLYKVYRLPNTDTPVSIMATGNVLSSLTHGTYRVVAIQALGSASNSQQQDVTINNNIAPFSISVSAANQSCAAGGNIIVNTLSGTPAFYEIISGPVTRPLQSSNTFTDLPSGTYNIRAFDVCGMGKVKTFTLNVVNSVLNISAAELTNPDDACDTFTATHTITPSEGAISYPLAVRFTLNPMNMGGESVIIDQVIATGEPGSAQVSTVVPRFLSESYSYALKVTDNCSTVYEKLDNEVNPAIGLAISPADGSCGEKYLIISPSLHKAPYTLTFISVPAGFVPTDFNPAANSQFTDASVTFGSETQPVPFGVYEVLLTDACGRTTTKSLNVQFIPPTPSARGTNNGCFSLFGRIRVSVPGGQVATATILDAPAAYLTTHTMPQNVTSAINASGTLALNNLPLGVYTISFTDNCGNTFTKDIEVPPFVERPFNIATLPGCDAGTGTIRLRSGNGNLTSAQIIAAPAAYANAHPLPYNVTAILNDGDLYMNNLPEGTYTFRAVDQCGITHDMPVNVEGYRAPQNAFTYTPNCGSFSVKVTDNSNGLEGASYWLQKFNAANNTWVHPSNGSVYAEGADPTNSGIRLNNNAVRNNLNFSGKFRIVKRFETFNQGTNDNSVCVSVLGDFTYTDGLSISNAYSLACIGEPNTVYIEALGYPTAYRIIKKNGANFVVQNGTNNIFHNLQPADYVFQVEDACGNIVTKPVSVQMLPSITEASQPTDMVACTAQGPAAGNQVFHLTDQNASVLGSLPAAMYTITYHLTQADADNGVNALPEYYTNVINNQTIYARLVHNEIALCHGTASFRLRLGQSPTVAITTDGKICDGNGVTLTATAGLTNYQWSNGATTRSIVVTQPGIYTVTAQRAYGDGNCTGVSEEVEIKASFTPRIVKIDTQDWSSHENTITVYAEGATNYEYSIDGTNWQESNVFEGLEPGQYTILVRDGLGCGIAEKEVALLYYPNFFTPNGDGYNEKWQIKYSVLEPQMKVTIFDRYGKVITSFGGMSDGWDGTLNGAKLPSTDYWFVVTREDGREYKGHFAMMR